MDGQLRGTGDKPPDRERQAPPRERERHTAACGTDGQCGLCPKCNYRWLASYDLIDITGDGSRIDRKWSCPLEHRDTNIGELYLQFLWENRPKAADRHTAVDVGRALSHPRVSPIWRIRHHPAITREIPPRIVRSYINVASQTSWRIPMGLPEGFQDSHQNGGPLFLIFVADPTMSRVPWNFGGGPVSIRLRSPGHRARRVRQVRRIRVRVLLGVPVGAGGR